MAKVNVIFDPAFRPTPITIRRCATDVRPGADVDHGEHANFLPRHGAAHDHDHSRHAGQTPRVRGRSRPHVLSEQRRPQGDDGSAPHRDRRARESASIAGTNAITIHDTPERIAAAGRLITMIDKARPEVLIDVELLEVNRIRLAGVRASVRVARTRPGINGVADVNRTGLTLDDLRNLSGSQILMTACPACTTGS